VREASGWGKTALQRIFIPQPYITASNSVLNDLGAIRRDAVIAIVRSKAIKYHIDQDLFLRIAKCESGFKADAQNKTSTASGIFQFLTSTFTQQAEAHGLLWTDKNDAETQAELAAHMIAEGGLRHWNASKDCWQ
jgi:soluble lytic murein transglycosylase-like protein